jgi:tellurite resistance protein TehA-like permease
MGVGIGIGLLAIGLVLALAVGNTVEGVDLVLIGWILAGVGALAIVVALIMTAQRSHQTIEHVTRDETGGQGGTGGGAGGSGAA